MARVKIEDVVDHLRSEMQNALAMAVRDVAPEASVNAGHLYQRFLMHLRGQCRTWERVPDRYVETD